MNSKKTASLLLTITFVLSVLAIPGMPGVAAFPSDKPTLWVSDATFYTAANLSCVQDFNVTINVFNVTGMQGISVLLHYNTTLLDCNRIYDTPITSGATVKQPVDGSMVFHYDAPPTINETYSGDTGQIWTAFFGFPAFSGSGAVFIYEFHVTKAPPRETVTVPENKSVSCDLVLSAGTGLFDAASEPIDCYLQDGYYEYIRPQQVVGDPTAICSIIPTNVYEGTPVTFDGSASDDGGAGPLRYLWDVNCDGTYEYNTTSTTVVHPNPVAGSFNVCLTVVNTIPRNNTAAPQYWTVLVKAGAIIDLYTSPNRWCGVDTDPELPGEGVGKGPDMPCDALSPDVNVTLFAEVTWNGAPVNHALVAFEVKWVWNVTWCEYVPDNATWTLVNEVVLMRTAETNKDGIAKIYMRIPTPCDGMMFGKWKAWAKTKVQEVPIEDTMEFDVGYVVTLCTLTILDPYPTFIREVDCLSAEIAFKSISWIPRSGYIAVTIYDICDVPIGTAWVPFETEPAEYCSPSSDLILVECIPIPQWAYVGFGKVYASAFTDFPQSCGVAYSPELSVTDIYIDWTPMP